MYVKCLAHSECAWKVAAMLVVLTTSVLVSPPVVLGSLVSPLFHGTGLAQGCSVGRKTAELSPCPHSCHR